MKKNAQNQNTYCVTYVTYFRTNDMMQLIKISLSFVFMFHFQRLNHRQVVMRCICRFTRRGSSSLFCVGRLNIFS